MYSVTELLNSYFTEKRLKTSTCQSYSVATRALIRRFGDCLVEEVDRDAILKWRSEMLDGRIKAVSWNTYVRKLRVLYEFGLATGKIALAGNPFENTQVRCPKRPSKTVEKTTLRTVRALLDLSAKEETEWRQQSQFHPAWFWRTVFETLIYTGIRANELLTLKVCDLDLQHGLLTIRADVSKNYHERKIPLHDNLMPYLKTLMYVTRKRKFSSNSQLFNVNLFSRRHYKKEMDMNQVSAFFKKLSKLTTQRVSSHRLRHTLATELMRDPDRNIHTVKDILGHKHIATTLKYVSVNEAQMRELINTFN
jgi:site-specific recombinase XerD